MRIEFLLSKDPLTEHGGDVELSRLVMRLAAEAFDVSAICLSGETGTPPKCLAVDGVPLVRVPKPAVDPRKLLVDAVRRRRSIVHVRYDTPPLRTAIEGSPAEVFVAEHSYMAETFLRSARAGHARLVVNTHISESLVWRVTRGVIGRIESPRILRDEVRVARAAAAVGAYDAAEAEFYRSRGVADALFLDVTIPPTEQLDLSATAPRLVFMGTRDWPPNQEAFLEALRLWPLISAGIADAELCVIGAKKPGAADPVYPPGVRDLGFVDDLQAFLGTCRAMVAPVKTGGGVRVKILDAASRGLPVVGTTAAVGSLASVLALPTFDDPAEFVAECRRYLLDASLSTTAGAQLYDVNREHWRLRKPHESIAALLGAGRPASPA